MTTFITFKSKIQDKMLLTKAVLKVLEDTLHMDVWASAHSKYGIDFSTNYTKENLKVKDFIESSYNLTILHVNYKFKGYVLMTNNLSRFISQEEIDILDNTLKLILNKIF